MSFLALVERILAAIKPAVRFYGFYLYEVTGDDRTRVTLRRVDDSGGYPDLPGKIDKPYGAHGYTCVSTVGSQVLIGFEGGNPARPFVAFCVPKNPVSVLVDADDTIQIATTPDIGLGPPGAEKKVWFGSKNRHPVARKDDAVRIGEIQFVPGAGTVQILQVDHLGNMRTIGTLAATSLVFTPDVSTLGVAQLDGHINQGSALVSSE